MAAGKEKISKQYILDRLEDDEVDLSACELTSFPVKELLQVPKAIKVDASTNQLDSLPDSIGNLKHLTSLDLSKNHIHELPQSIGQLVNLKRLDLFGNEIQTLPLSFRHLKQLQFLDLKKNPLDKELADVAGSCVDEKECRDCAKRVLQYLKEKASEEERQRQKELERKRELERQRALEEEKAQNELRQRKKQEKQRRKEEHKKLEEERRKKLEKNQHSSDESETQSEDGEDAVRSTREVKRQPPGKCLCCLAVVMAILGTVLVIASLVISQCPAGSAQCPNVVKFFQSTGIYYFFPSGN